jgi:hypothetical protein|tara:strand:- start:8512 stop:8685 length:174 start_codon:yes stop_codon:yes gene_type:complete
MPKMPKPFWKSRTVWMNVAAAVLATVSEWNNPVQVAQALALANVVIRFFTTQPVSSS